MKSMLRASLATAACLAATATVLAPEAKAQTQTVTFSGTVPASCTFTPPTAGVLDLDATGNILSSTEGTGAAATTDVTCTASGGVVSITAPTLTAGTDPGFTLTSTVATPADGTADSGGTTVTLSTAVTGATFTVNMAADAGAAVPAGVYDFEVDVTIAP